VLTTLCIAAMIIHLLKFVNTLDSNNTMGLFNLTGIEPSSNLIPVRALQSTIGWVVLPEDALVL